MLKIFHLIVTLLAVYAVAQAPAVLEDDSLTTHKQTTPTPTPNLKTTKATYEIPEFEVDNNQKRKSLDFSIPLKPISNTDLLLSHFANQNLVIFFFSAKCMHCQDAFPYIQKFSDEIESKGVKTIAIAVKNNSDSDIRNFIRQFKCTIPVFKDDQRLFSRPYGTGRIPLTIAVNSSGEYIRFKSFKNEKTTKAIFDLFATGRIDQ